MSEAEKKRRFDYKQNRNKWIRIQALVIAMVSLLTVLFAVVYYNTSKNYYINYTEDSKIDYQVYLKENDFYEDMFLGKDQVYVASLIDKVSADLFYELNMEEEVTYSYSYEVKAVLEIADRKTGLSIYRPEYELVPKTTFELDDPQKKLTISKNVEIDYDTYNKMANDFIKTYSLEDITSAVVIKMEIEVISACENFQDENSRNDYVVSLNIPLSTKKVNVEMTSTVPQAETKILACTQNASKIFFLVLFILTLVIDAALIVLLIGFIFLTRNTDINYSIKVNKIVSAYKSYIQQIMNPFDDTGYQILLMKDFTEMLEIRDTIQSPILMNENEDKTCTRFLIPTNTKLLYVYEIKVDDYDEIYNTVEEEITDELPEIEDPIIEEEPVEEIEEIIEEIPAEPEMEEETVVLLEKVDEEILAEAIAAPSISLSKIDYDMDDDEDEEEGVEVIGVVWPERPRHNKVYRYDPNGERVTNGDIVLVPSRDVKKNRDIVRKATVAHGNHKVDPEHLKHPLKKIIGVVKRKAEAALMPKEPVPETKEPAENAEKTEDSVVV